MMLIQACEMGDVVFLASRGNFPFEGVPYVITFPPSQVGSGDLTPHSGMLT